MYVEDVDVQVGKLGREGPANDGMKCVGLHLTWARFRYTTPPQPMLKGLNGTAKGAERELWGGRGRALVVSG